MKIKYFYQLLLFFVAQYATAQIGIDNPNPDASAILDLTSTSKGLLAPRMTQTERNAISSPATGLLIYQIDATDGFYVYDGSAWIKILNTGDANSYSAGSGLNLIGTTFSVDSSVVTSTYGGSLSISGTVTANAFVGDGSRLTGLTDNDTTYTAGSGLQLDGTNFSIDSTVVTANYSGAVRASAFIGDGSGLTNLPSTFNDRQFIIGTVTSQFTASNNDEFIRKADVISSNVLTVTNMVGTSGDNWIQLTQGKTYQITCSAAWQQSSGMPAYVDLEFQIYPGYNEIYPTIKDHIISGQYPTTRSISTIYTPQNANEVIRLRFYVAVATSVTISQLYWSIREL